MSIDLQPIVKILNTEETQTQREANFRRSVAKIIVEKFGGDVFAYIKNLVDTIDTLENNLENAANAILQEAA